MIENLRKITADAIKKYTEQQQKDAATDAEEKLVVRRQHKTKAKAIIDLIQDKCERAASKMNSSAVVMNLKWDRDYDRDYYGSPKTENLRGPAKIVWDYCIENKLNPTIGQWDDGVGINGGYTIVVNW